MAMVTLAKSADATLESLRDTRRDTRQVQLWTLRLPVEDFRRTVYWESLSGDERKRAARFHFERDREAFVSARGRLRELIGQYLSIAPGKVVFSYGAQDKPAVENACGLQFNLAHSGDWALFGFCADSRIGVDIERVRAMADQEALAARFFSPEECADLMHMPKAERESAFFACWTRKEAYVKAVGSGLSLPLDSFRVTLLPEAAPELLASRDGGRWTLFDLNPAEGYRGAVAVEGQDWALNINMMDHSITNRSPSEVFPRQESIA